MRHAGIRWDVEDAALLDGAVSRLERQIPSMEEVAQATQDGPVFAILYMLIPPPPLIWDTNELAEKGGRSLEEVYAGNLRRMDFVIGKRMPRLREAGSWDASMVVLTSDHGWRESPSLLEQGEKMEEEDPSHGLRLVPLVVKFPSQKQPDVVEEPFETKKLHSLIEKFLQTSYTGE
ncbi:MAG: sulfatase-like hydrolase/transferase [Verrucomicrobiota bacterium]|nr:sulfatase-like hydrolase/transferase [Verrucomicrobiota bacterium]